MIAKTINEYIADQRAVERKKSGKFSVGDAGRCHLMRYWKRQEKPTTDEPDERAFRVFQVGHIFHEWIQDILAKKGLLMRKEFGVEDEHRKGILDAVCLYEDKTILYDFKTVHSRKFHYMRNAETGVPQDMHYCLQVLTYEAMLPFPVDSVRLAYISKDDLCIEEIEVPDLHMEMEDDWQKLITCWTYQQEPIAKPMDWECGYCSYRSGCEQKVIKEPKPRKKKDSLLSGKSLEVKDDL